MGAGQSRSALATSTPTSSIDPDAELMNLPPELRALIIRSLTRTAARTLAATTSVALRDVLEARIDLKTFSPHRLLARSIGLLTFSAAGDQRSKVEVRCSHGGTTLSVYIPLHALPLVCTEQQHAEERRLALPFVCAEHQHADKHRPAHSALFCFSPAVIASTQKLVAGDDSRFVRLCTLPPGMTALTEIHLSHCILEADWLPPSSSSRVRSLHITAPGPQFQCPRGMSSLVDLTLALCPNLPEIDWLPESSCGSVRRLEICRSDVRSLPGGMFALQCLYLSGCISLARDWLPESSKQRVRVLSADAGCMSRVPSCMRALEALRFSENMTLPADWLPASSRSRVRVLFVDHSSVSSIPDDMGALETLSVEGCRSLVAKWLPTSSSKRVKVVNAAGSSLERLPADMGALSVIDVRRCNNLVDNWLPASSDTCVRQLRAGDRCMQRLPQSMSWLVSLRVLGPDMPNRELALARAREQFDQYAAAIGLSPLLP